MSREGLPRAYLRIDPNLDMTHPDPGAFVRLLCAAARQPDRGRFRDRGLLERAVGRAKVRALASRGDIAQLPDGRWYVVGWDEWQEGDLDVASRMRRVRERRRQEGYATPRSGRERTADWRLKKEILTRDLFSCRYCGAYEYPPHLLVAEHVIPSPEGATTAENLVTACQPCNVRKGQRTPEEAGMILQPIGYRSATDPLGDTPRVTRLVTRHQPPKRVTVTTDAYRDDSLTVVPLGVGVGVDSPPSPHEWGRRRSGTHPRAQRTAPRDLGENPRANGQSPRQEREAQKTGPTKLGEIMSAATSALADRNLPAPAPPGIPADQPVPTGGAGPADAAAGTRTGEAGP